MGEGSGGEPGLRRPVSLVERLLRRSLLVTLGSLLVSGLGIGVLMLLDARATLESKADYLENLLTETLPIALRETSDYLLAAKIGRTAARDPDLAGLTIADGAGRIIFARQSDRRGTLIELRRSFSVEYGGPIPCAVSLVLTDSGATPRLARMLAWTTLLLFAASLANLLLIARSIRRGFGAALASLGAAAAEYARGDYSRDIGAFGKYREFAEVAATISSMVGTIRAQVVELKGLSAGLERKVEDIGKILDERTVLLGEINHRVMNNLQILNSLAEQQASVAQSEETRRVLRAIESRANAMALVYSLLAGSEDLSSIDAGEFVERLVSMTPLPPGVRLSTRLESIRVDVSGAVAFGLAAGELLRNAADHAYLGPESAGEIRVALESREGRILFRVEDDGVGFDRSAVREAGSVGLSLVEILAHQLRGVFSLEAARGSSARLDFPSEVPGRFQQPGEEGSIPGISSGGLR